MVRGFLVSGSAYFLPKIDLSSYSTLHKSVILFACFGFVLKKGAMNIIIYNNNSGLINVSTYMYNPA